MLTESDEELVLVPTESDRLRYIADMSAEIAEMARTGEADLEGILRAIVIIAKPPQRSPKKLDA